MTQLMQPQAESNRILWEVLRELQPHRDPLQHAAILRADQVQRLRPLLDYVCRLHWRAGPTEEGEAALKRFVYRFLSGDIPFYD
jgi:hypothetical protein